MQRFSVLAVLMVLAVSIGHAADLSLRIARVEAPAWIAEQVELRIQPPHHVQIRIGRITVSGQPSLRDLSVRCRHFESASGLRCDDAAVAVTLPGWGRTEGVLRLNFRHAHEWQAQLRIPARKLNVQLTQRGEHLQVSGTLSDAPAAALQQLAQQLGIDWPGEASGLLSVSGDARFHHGLESLSARLTSVDFNYSEATGRYATEKLTALAEVDWSASKGHLNLTLQSSAGQAYLEPLFMDFSALPLRVSTKVQRVPTGWHIEQLEAAQGSVATLHLNGLLNAAYQPVDVTARYDVRDLAPVVQTDLAPFLIGTALDGLRMSGGAVGEIEWKQGAIDRLTVRLAEAGIDADKIGISLAGLQGILNWSAAGVSANSNLSWRSGTLKQIPLGPSHLRFQASGRDFTLLETWRQPLLGGAWVAERLRLQHMGQPQMTADFAGAVEPINMAALSRALAWPEFGGTLSGRLPGLSIRDDIWTIDGALEAQVFGGSIRIANLRAIQPFGVLPRVMADVEARRLDLEALTRAFSFGRITGRVNAEVTGLRLLDGYPAAFDGRLYSTPGDTTDRRISQRAIDTISSIGGGPTGAVSRGFLGLFQDFSYDRIGLSCQLRDGVCEMNGVEPTRSKDGLAGYYIVKGRLLPRIDVVGYAQRVSLTSLLDQLKAAIASGGPEVAP